MHFGDFFPHILNIMMDVNKKKLNVLYSQGCLKVAVIWSQVESDERRERGDLEVHGVCRA